MESVKTKRCSGRPKWGIPAHSDVPVTEFGIDKNQKDGFTIICRSCLNSYNRLPEIRAKAKIRSQSAAGKAIRARHREKRRDAGLCDSTGCTNSPAIGKFHCLECSEEMTRLHRELRAKKRKDGICIWSGCKNPSENGYDGQCRFHKNREIWRSHWR